MRPPPDGVAVKVAALPLPPDPPLPPTATKPAELFAPLPPPPPIDWTSTPWAFLSRVSTVAEPCRVTVTGPPPPPPPELSPRYCSAWLPPTVPPLPPIDWARIPNAASPPPVPLPVAIDPEWVTVTAPALVGGVSLSVAAPRLVPAVHTDPDTVAAASLRTTPPPPALMATMP